MQFRDVLPFNQAPKPQKRANALPASSDPTPLKRAMRVASLALGFNEGLPFSGRANFESPPYDFARIQSAIDTDSYAKQAFAKHRELFWKEGWELVSENQEAVDYLWQRIDYLEITMKQPFTSFLKEVVDNLFKFHNVFIVKARDTKGVLSRFFPGEISSNDSRGPIIGFYLIPTETVEVQRDIHNRPVRYRQAMSIADDYVAGDRKTPTWDAKDVIHISLDKRTGKIFGTPFMSATLDDLMSLRQIEEDILNLIHRELFPLFSVKVGSDEQPAEQEEIDDIHNVIGDLRTEGALVYPHRHEVSILGTEGEMLDASSYLNHFKERCAIGLGVYPHHLGMTGSGANRAMTDRLDVMLYDKIKERQSEIADQIRFNIIDELLREGGFNPSINPKLKGVSDRVIMKFSDIDQDTKVKKETHIIQKVTSGIETIDEGRLELGMDPNMDEEKTLPAMHQRLTPAPGGGQAPDPKNTTTPTASQKPSTGGTPNRKNLTKGSSNIIRPTNQHGSRTSPNIRHQDDDWLREAVELIDGCAIIE